MSKTILITGATGRVGRHSARAFEAAGWNVKRFRRGSDMTHEAKGADVIVNGMNPPNYKDWHIHLPEITNQHIAAAKASGALVIIPGNVYNFGADTSGVWDADTPQIANSRKGTLRVDLEASYRASGIRTLVLRGGNFIDPDRNDDVMSLVHLSRLSSNRIVTPGRPDAKLAWCYLPDWAAAAVRLAEKENLPRFADIPFAGHTLSTVDIKAAMESVTGRPFKIATMPWWAIKVASPFWTFGRELLEMRYLWDLDHSLSDTPLRTHLGSVTKTTFADVLTRKLGQLNGNETLALSRKTELGHVL